MTSKGLYGLNKDLYPAKMGSPWDKEEINNMLTSIQKGKTIEQLSQLHERTQGGIRGKLMQLAAEYYINDNKSIDEIEKLTSLSDEVILDAVQKRQYTDSIKKRKDDAKAKAVPVSNTPDLADIKKDIKELKVKVDKILELMTAVYDFEQSQ
jgi:hypothetical protein